MQGIKCWPNEMNCFIASAFDHEDVDAIFDRAIRPVLSELKLRPYRADRVEHNDDIDDQIFKLIDQSHICIADLTYARPSVYYEAGYAFGTGKPVIYIARRDHFRHRENDPCGNLRVHFDLQMKNIIWWTEPNEAFKNRLCNRLRLVMKPMLQQQKVAEVNREHEKQFVAMSQRERLNALLRKSQNLLRSRGYSSGKFPVFGPDGQVFNHAYFHKTLDMTYRQIDILALTEVNKPSLNVLQYIWFWSLKKEQIDKFDQIDSICIGIALSSVRTSKLPTLFPDWKPIKDRLLWRDDMGGKMDEKPHRKCIAVIDGVKSVESFSESFRSLIEELEG